MLELLWTLARGFTVVLHGAPPAADAPAAPAPEFSLFYFATDESRQGSDRYRLLMEGARFADANGFAAVWTPERHFHAFGGLYPNAAVTSAALATMTSRVQIRAGKKGTGVIEVPFHGSEDFERLFALLAGREASEIVG